VQRNIAARSPPSRKTAQCPRRHILQLVREQIQQIIEPEQANRLALFGDDPQVSYADAAHLQQCPRDGFVFAEQDRLGRHDVRHAQAARINPTGSDADDDVAVGEHSDRALRAIRRVPFLTTR